MRIDRLRPGQIGEEQLDVAVVIDVLRATSTAVVLAGRGVDHLLVVATPAELEGIGADNGRYLLFSELKNVDPVWPRVDNSPAIALRTELDGLTPVLVSTNGTIAVRRAAKVARQVILGSFLNVHSVAQYLLEQQPERVTLVPCGDIARDRPHNEDDKCAAIIEALLRGERCDPLAIAAQCDLTARVRKGIPIAGSGFTEDMRLSLTPDLFTVVPIISFGAREADPMVVVPKQVSAMQAPLT